MKTSKQNSAGRGGMSRTIGVNRKRKQRKGQKLEQSEQESKAVLDYNSKYNIKESAVT